MNTAEKTPPTDSAIGATDVLKGPFHAPEVHNVGEIPLPPIIPPADRVNVHLERGEYVFDFDVPLPRKKGGARGTGAASNVPFGRIPAGASFFARGAKQSTVSSAATAYRKRNKDAVFVTAYFEIDPKYHIAGVRVWRLR